jgi:hypothetical protein
MLYLKKINYENIKNFLYLSRVELLKIFNRSKINEQQTICILHYYDIFLNLYEMLCDPYNVNMTSKNKQYLLHYIFSEILKCVEEIKWELQLKIWPVSV